MNEGTNALNSSVALEILEQLVASGQLGRITDRKRRSKAILYRTLSGRSLGLELGNGLADVEEHPDGSFRLRMAPDTIRSRSTVLVLQRSPAELQLDRSALEAMDGVGFRDPEEQLKSSAYFFSGANLGAGKQQLVDVTTTDALHAVIEWYGSAMPQFDRAVLEELRRIFLRENPDFIDFSQSGTFGSKEDHYKRALISETANILKGASDGLNAEIGDKVLNLVQGKGGLPCNLLDRRTSSLLTEIRQSNPGAMEAAAAKLIAAEDGKSACATFAEEFWSLLPGNLPSNPFAESRTIPTMVRALVDPVGMFPIRSRPTDNASKMLLGEWAFGSNPLTQNEVGKAIELAERILQVMRDEWHWAPRDFWDVQGFLWETCQTRLDQATDATTSLPSPVSEIIAMPEPTNLILYGPPGTGKTYASAAEAVRLCRPDLLDDDPLFTPAERTALLKEYERLKSAGQIDFVTFHQSYGYEDFVEGLRPPVLDVSDEAGGGSVGLTLEVRPGIFRNMARNADQARLKPRATSEAFDLGQRRIFKMSLGRAGVEDYIFDQAIEGGYVVLGWGGQHDWSDASYSGEGGWQKIYERWQEIEPGTSPYSGNVAQLWNFRTFAQTGDIVVISSGNSQFRAIGEITGDYRFEPTGNSDYNHRRAVRWLLVPDEPMPVDLIYTKGFSMVSFYQLRQDCLKREALERLLAPPATGAEEANGVPDQFVLVIDEINRANISKVFGELITLIETDKRLGSKEERRVRLPYSGKEFGVPANLHIIGTMNTADRSIALLDTALRRRFNFRELSPDPALLPTDVDGVNLRQVLTTINNRVEYLIDREHRIGHAFFIGCASLADINAAMRDKVIPLLQEYFFEDWSRVHAVLGDEFIGKAELAPPPGVYGEIRMSWFVRAEFARSSYDRLGGRVTAEVAQVGGVAEPSPA